MVKKYGSPCCALALIKAENEDSFEDLQAIVETCRAESKQNFTRCLSSYENYQGQTALHCVTTVAEPQLEANLEKLGFQVIREVRRRTGYEQTPLKLWWLDFPLDKE